MGYAGKVLMLVENNYPQDPRVRREAVTLTQAGYKVTVLALLYPGQTRKECIDGVDVYRIPPITVFRKGYGQPRQSKFQITFHRIKAIFGYMNEYLYFTFACLLICTRLFFKTGINIVHLNNPPDTLFLVGIWAKLLNKKVVFDHHDVSPELYLSRYNADKDIVYQMLCLIERICLKISDIVIATNASYKAIEIKRGKIKPETVYIVRNGPDLDRVKRVPPDTKLKNMNKTILCYLGAMNPQDGLDYLLRSLHKLVYELGRTDFYCVLIGSGDVLEELKELAVRLKIEDYVWFTGYVSDEDMLRYLSTADICVDPDPSSPLNDVSTWIKIMEYMALEKPIVTFDLKETHYSAQAAAKYVKPNDELEFAQAVSELMDNPKERKKMGEFGKKRVRNELAWEHVSRNLIEAYRAAGQS